jgi:hypothetical protein
MDESIAVTIKSFLFPVNYYGPFLEFTLNALELLNETDK